MRIVISGGKSVISSMHDLPEHETSGCGKYPAFSIDGRDSYNAKSQFRSPETVRV
jgi:hypothetical protein